MRSTPTRHKLVDGQALARHKPWKGYPPNKGRMFSDILGTLVGGSALHSRDQVDGWMGEANCTRTHCSLFKAMHSLARR